MMYINSFIWILLVCCVIDIQLNTFGLFPYKWAKLELMDFYIILLYSYETWTLGKRKKDRSRLLRYGYEENKGKRTETNAIIKRKGDWIAHIIRGKDSIGEEIAFDR